MLRLDAFNSTWMERKKHLILPLENLSFMRNRKEGSNQRRREPESQNQLRRRKSPQQEEDEAKKDMAQEGIIVCIIIA